MNQEQVRELCSESHRIAKEHGWLEKPRSFGTIIALFHSELSEALEEFRAGRKLDELYYEFKKGGLSHVGTASELQQARDNGYDAKPAGIPVELADFLIRIAEAVETLCFTHRFSSFVNVEPEMLATSFESELIPQLHASVSRAYSWSPDAMSSSSVLELAQAFGRTLTFCRAKGIDIEKALEIKAAYNEKRSFRHGNKVV